MKSIIMCRSVSSLLAVLFLAFLNLNQAEEPLHHTHQITYSGDTIVEENAPFTITCTVKLFEPIKWTKDNQPINDSRHAYKFEETSQDGVVVASLFVKRAAVLHSGSYKCNALHSESHVVKVTVAAVRNSVVAKDKTKPFDVRSPLVLSCNVTFSDPNTKYVLEWYKNDEPVANIPSLKDRYKTIAAEDKFVIDRTTQDDAGNYTCIPSVNGVPEKDMTGTIEAIAKPAIKVPSSISVIEGEKLKIVCVVLGRPRPTIHWEIRNETYKESEGRIKLTSDEENDVPNSILIVEDLQMTDRGEYVCIAENAALDIVVRDMAMVRVKDKMAALWPFLGICAEVFVLCAIILIYEKKRNKTELEESDDQSPETKPVSDDAKDADVRQRK